MDICSGYHGDTFCIAWTAILPDYCMENLCVGNSNGSNISCQEYEYRIVHGYCYE